MSTPTEAEVRAEVREWIAANWNPDMSPVSYTHLDVYKRQDVTRAPIFVAG